MKTVRRHLLALACLSALLVSIEIQATSIPDSLPALVLDETDPAAESKGSAVTNSAPASPEPAKSDPTESSTKVSEEKDPKLISYETRQEESQPAAAVSSEKPAILSSEADSSSTSEKPETNNKETTSQSTPENSNSSPAEPSASGASSEKDINVLLANKNDADNDLASSASPTSTESEVKPQSSSEKSELDKKQLDLDSPVDTNKQSSNDDRLHYAFGNPDKAPEESKVSAEPEVAAAAAPVKPSEPTPETALDAKKDEEAKPETPKPEATPSSTSEKPKEDETKKVEFDEKTKSVVVESVGSSEASSTVKPAPTENEEKPASTGSESASPAISSAESSTAEPAASTTSKSSSDDTTTVAPSESPKEKEKEKPQVAVATTTPESKPVEVNKTSEVSSEKPASIPTILAVALGSALGAAVAPKQIPVIKEVKPKIEITNNGSSIATSTTTKAPSSVSTTKKSSTDKWDRWNPSTSTVSPTRRRPILPSIRRRFRPYNRFSPFPWGGADSYSPIGGNEPEYVGAEVTPPKPASTTNKPRRRASSTTEVPKSSTSTTSTHSPADDDDVDEDKVDEPTTTRRRPGVNKRRHHHHHRHHHEHHPHNPSEFGARRRYNPDQKFHHSSFGDHSPNEPSAYPHPPRPHVPGFSLFNVGSTGSGFDLLNPFSGWLDDVNKPRPPIRGSNIPSASSPPLSSSPSRPVGHRPAPFDGNYNEDHGHHHEHGYQGSRPNGRDDYHDHHDHHHDCHEHDYDHHHDHHRPNRHRDREPLRPPVGGDYDTYPPASFGHGRRPGRPYIRRDQADKENENSEASPSLYGWQSSANSQPVAPKRVPSIFSPFDSLFGSLDDEIFSLRSSFIDAPLKSDSTQTFDAVITSPKISMPSVEVVGDKESPTSGASGEKVKEVSPLVDSNNSSNNGKLSSGESVTALKRDSGVERQLSSFLPNSFDTLIRLIQTGL